ncbi:LON peptidase N-terminal domain and RING finger protein 1 isoform X2 [Heterodontus francisci]|uniref:LON peptidase N-terminal domain and RING finger protein 1 isoform X2 n=1 Tax=Heterodontus francisci TaxID=7792 RepID=UPI00355C52C3
MEPVPGVLGCPLCRRLLREPVTAACGHSLCRRCVSWGRCPVCREPLEVPGSRVNVLASGLMQKWLTEEAWLSAGSGFTEPPESAPDDGQSRTSQAEAQAGIQVAGDRLDQLEVDCKRSTEGLENLSLETVGCLQDAQVSLIQDVSSGQRLMVLQPMVKEATNKLSAEELSSPVSEEKNAPDSSPCPQSVLRDLLSVSDFECSVCTKLLFEPVTTPCGHTFCKKCVERCLDYRPCCPLCKEDLRKFLQQRQYRVTQLLDALITIYFSTECAERKLLNEMEMAELSNLTSNIPIFVCAMAFPGISCPLHIFEPRYRLMMRRCLETGTKTFGMCVYDRGKIFADYGCMLKIERSEDLPDGRSLIDTVGGRRFKVLRRSRRDGYSTADVEYLEDKLASPDGPRWCWWLLAVIPMDPALQTLVLSSTSLNDRLIHLQRVLDYLAQNQIQ